MMKTIQMTIDDELLAEVDRASQALHTNRSAFIRSALRLALQQFEIRQLEQQHATGYQHKPVQPEEFDGWETSRPGEDLRGAVVQAIDHAVIPPSIRHPQE